MSVDGPSNIFAIVISIGLLICVLADLRLGIHRIMLGRTVVLTSVFLWYLLEALRVPQELKKYTQAEYDGGLLLVVLSVAVFLAVYHTGTFPVFAPLARRLPMLDQPRVLWLLVLGGMTIGLGCVVIYSGDIMELFQGLTGMRRRWTGVGRSRYGSWSTIIFELQMFLIATVPPATALLFMKRAPLLQRLIAGLFVTWMFLRTFWSGSRTGMIPILLSLTAAVFWTASPSTRRRLIIFGLPLALLVGYFWSAVIVAGRNAGKFDTTVAQKVDYVGFEMFRELLFISRATQKSMPLQWGLTYYTQMVNPIPRAIWPGKPVADAGLIMARAYGAIDKNGEPTMTTSPGFLGEAYLNFGFLGLFIIPGLAGILVRAWDTLLPAASRSLPTFMVYAAGLATIFASGRSFNFANYYGLLAFYMLMVAFEVLGIGTPSQFAPPPRPLQKPLRPVPAPSSRGSV